jgi:hypothetical protein
MHNRVILGAHERRAKDYRAHRPMTDAVILELTRGVSKPELWRQMLDGPSTRMTRIIPPTTLAKTYGQDLLPPMLRGEASKKNPRTPFLVVQYYLNHFPQGLGTARKELGKLEAEAMFSRLAELMAREKLTGNEIIQAGDILHILHEVKNQNRTLKAMIAVFNKPRWKFHSESICYCFLYGGPDVPDVL